MVHTDNEEKTRNTSGRNNGKTTRRRAREATLQILYQLDLIADESWEWPKEHADAFWQRFQNDNPELKPNTLSNIRKFAETIIQNTISERPGIDQYIRNSGTKWELGQMAIIDRNILRLAVCEIAYNPEVPNGVVINEAVELAKTFGNQNSPRFVNGVLDAVARTQQQN